MDAVKEAAVQSQYLTFELAGEDYAVDVLKVKEIIEYDTLTTVPATPAPIRGVINLRGNVVPVVDLAVKFGLPGTRITKRTCIVIVEVSSGGDPLVMGVMSDAVCQVIDLLPEDIEPPPAFGTRAKTDYLLGMGKNEKKFLLMLDIDRVLSVEELAAAETLQVVNQAGPAAEQPEEPAPMEAG